MSDESIFLRALRKENLPIPPIWYMRTNKEKKKKKKDRKK